MNTWLKIKAGDGVFSGFSCVWRIIASAVLPVIVLAFSFAWASEAVRPFVFSIEVPEDGAEFVFGAERARLNIDWGDGGEELFEGHGVMRRRYEEAGTYQVSLEGEALRIHFYVEDEGTPEMLLDIISPLYPGVSGITSTREMFAGAIRITEFSAENWFDEASSNVTDMRAMFRNAKNFNQDLNSWDTSSVSRMGGFLNGVFWGAESFNGEIGAWDTSNVTSMVGLFRGARSFNCDIGDWDVTSVSHMIFMFMNALSFNQDIGGWDVSGVTSMYAMFRSADSFNQDIGEWDVSGVRDMRAMFSNSGFNRDISTKVVNKGTDEEYLAWDVSNVEGMGGESSWLGMFQGSPFNGDISNWDVSGVTDMRYMFRRSDFDGDISGWDVSWASYLGNLEGFFEGARFSTENYDRLLVNWSQLELGEGVKFDGGESEYSMGFPEARRNYLIEELGWEITDGGDTGLEYTLSPVITLVASVTGRDSAMFTGKLLHLSGQEPARVYFEYREMVGEEWHGTDAEVMDGGGKVSIAADGLESGLFYEFRCVSEQSGREYLGNVERFRIW